MAYRQYYTSNKREERFILDWVLKTANKSLKGYPAETARYPPLSEDVSLLNLGIYTCVIGNSWLHSRQVLSVVYNPSS